MLYRSMIWSAGALAELDPDEATGVDLSIAGSLGRTAIATTNAALAIVTRTAAMTANVSRFRLI